MLQHYGLALTEDESVPAPNRRPINRPKYEWPPIPHPDGRELMKSGKFGYHQESLGGLTKSLDVHHKLMERELGLESPKLQRIKLHATVQSMTPGSQPDSVINFNYPGYCGQFSDDGDYFFTCNQDGRIRLYDTSNPYEWKFYKAAVHPRMRWTLTDASMSPDSRFIASCSLCPDVSLISTEKTSGSGGTAQLLDFARSQRSSYSNFGV